MEIQWFLHELLDAVYFVIGMYPILTNQYLFAKSLHKTPSKSFKELFVSLNPPLVVPLQYVGCTTVKLCYNMDEFFIYSQDTPYVEGLMQKRRNSSANALELRLFCIKPFMSPIRVRYLVLFVGSKSSLCSTFVTEVLYAISYHIGLWYTVILELHFNIIPTKWPGSLRHQIISRHGIDFYTIGHSPYITWDEISTTCTCHIKVKEWCKMQIHINLFKKKKNSTHKRVNVLLLSQNATVPSVQIGSRIEHIYTALEIFTYNNSHRFLGLLFAQL